MVYFFKHSAVCKLNSLLLKNHEKSQTVRKNAKMYKRKLCKILIAQQSAVSKIEKTEKKRTSQNSAESKSEKSENKSEYFDEFKFEFETISNAYRYSRFCKILVNYFDF